MSTETSLRSRSFRSESQRSLNNPDFSQPSSLTLKESCALRVFATWSVFGAIKQSYQQCCAYLHSMSSECCYTLLWANNANNNNGRVHLAFPTWNTANSNVTNSNFWGKWNAPKGFGWNVQILNKYKKKRDRNNAFFSCFHFTLHFTCEFTTCGQVMSRKNPQRTFPIS